MHLSRRSNKAILESIKNSNKNSNKISEGADQPGNKEQNTLDTTAAAKKADKKGNIDKAAAPGNTATPKGKEAPDTGSMKGKGIDKVKAEVLLVIESTFEGLDEAAGIAFLESIKALKEAEDDMPADKKDGDAPADDKKDKKDREV